MPMVNSLPRYVGVFYFPPPKNVRLFNSLRSKRPVQKVAEFSLLCEITNLERIVLGLNRRILEVQRYGTLDSLANCLK